MASSTPSSNIPDFSLGDPPSPPGSPSSLLASDRIVDYAHGLCLFISDHANLPVHRNTDQDNVMCRNLGDQLKRQLVYSVENRTILMTRIHQPNLDLRGWCQAVPLRIHGLDSSTSTQVFRATFDVLRNNSASVQVGQSSTPHPLAEEEEEEEEDLPSNLAAQLLAMLPANAVQGLRDTFLAQTMALSYAPVIGKAHHLVVLSPSAALFLPQHGHPFPPPPPEFPPTYNLLPPAPMDMPISVLFSQCPLWEQVFSEVDTFTSSSFSRIPLVSPTSYLLYYYTTEVWVAGVKCGRKGPDSLYFQPESVYSWRNYATNQFHMFKLGSLENPPLPILGQLLDQHSEAFSDILLAASQLLTFSAGLNRYGVSADREEFCLENNLHIYMPLLRDRDSGTPLLFSGVMLVDVIITLFLGGQFEMGRHPFGREYLPCPKIPPIIFTNTTLLVYWWIQVQATNSPLNIAMQEDIFLSYLEAAYRFQKEEPASYERVEKLIIHLSEDYGYEVREAAYQQYENQYLQLGP